MFRRFYIKELFHPSRRRLGIIIVGLVIGVASLLITNDMSSTLRNKERNEVMLWALAMNRLGRFDDLNDPLMKHITSKNNIPFILTDQNLRVCDHWMVDEETILYPDRLKRQLELFSDIHQPLTIKMWEGDYYLFYGESQLLKMLVYFPLAQMIIIVVFIFFGYATFQSTRHDEQNSVWIGLAKETAHQLGTPISSLLGWIEYLRMQPVDQATVEEIARDVSRLTTVTNRFSKIGSHTSLVEASVNEVVGECVQYFLSRIPKNISLVYNGFAIAPVKAMLNGALFEWVIENLLKNALDAMGGKGTLTVKISSTDAHVTIDVSDTGKGIPKSNFSRIFEPGFTTKTRGWGLGLSLSKRIVEEYHKGKIFVVDSEIDKGSKIRITLKRAP
ncbi:MAG: sensor histidine kinase [Rikenellaceae bacterium]|jgi:signal transduction histidine kinase|nr:sensor histidine kinase [Rikenellaceae bacterium]